jgi:hypothetical protein
VNLAGKEAPVSSRPEPSNGSRVPFQPLSDEAWKRVTRQVREFMVWKRAGRTPPGRQPLNSLEDKPRSKPTE